jgi:hypothetical protein
MLMKDVAEDALLRIARLLITGLMGLSLLVAVGAPVTMVVWFAMRRDINAALASQGYEPSAFGWVVVLIALIAAIGALTFLFTRELRRVVASVSQGDPFIVVNAERLRHMAWLVVAIQAVRIPMSRLVVWFDAEPHSPNVHHGEYGVSIGWLILALILFVLARVFREGTRLRDEVEGTV